MAIGKEGTGYWSKTGWVEGGLSSNDPEYANLTKRGEIYGVGGNQGIVGSSMVRDEVSKVNATNNAKAEFTPVNSNNMVETSPYDNFLGKLISDMGQSQKSGKAGILSRGADYMNSINQWYDAKLGVDDVQYKYQMENLNRKMDKSLQVAKANAIALNPYSQARGAQTAENFQTAISTEYGRVAQEMTDKYKASRELMRAGQTKEAMALRASIESDVANLEKDMYDNLLDVYKTMQDEREFQTTLGENQRQFSISQQNTMRDDFLNYATELQLPDPTDIASMSDQELLALPAAQVGLNANMDINGIRQSLIGSAQKQQQEAYYRSAQIANMNRLAADSATQTKWQATMAAQQGAMNAAAASGYAPGTIEYAKIAAGATVTGSQPTAADKSFYTDSESLFYAAENFKSELEKISDNSRARNMLSTFLKNPFDDEAQTFLSAQAPAVYRVASVAFGQGGRALSDADFTRVESAIGSGSQSVAARDEIFQDWVGSARNAMVNKLQIDALSGVNVAGFAPAVEQSVKKVDTLLKKDNPEENKKLETDVMNAFKSYGITF